MRILTWLVLIAASLLPRIALADPSPTCGCNSGFSAFGNGPDATAWNQIFLPNRTICLQDGVTPNSDGQGTPAIQPCGPKTAGSGNGGKPAPNPFDRDLTTTVGIRLELEGQGQCIHDVKTLLLNADKVVGGSGEIVEPTEYCRGLFPLAERKDMPLNPSLAVTITFHGLKDCVGKAELLKTATDSGPFTKFKTGSTPEEVCTELFQNN